MWVWRRFLSCFAFSKRTCPLLCIPTPILWTRNLETRFSPGNSMHQSLQTHLLLWGRAHCSIKPARSSILNRGFQFDDCLFLNCLKFVNLKGRPSILTCQLINWYLILAVATSIFQKLGPFGEGWYPVSSNWNPLILTAASRLRPMPPGASWAPLCVSLHDSWFANENFVKPEYHWSLILFTRLIAGAAAAAGRLGTPDETLYILARSCERGVTLWMYSFEFSRSSQLVRTYN